MFEPDFDRVGIARTNSLGDQLRNFQIDHMPWH